MEGRRMARALAQLAALLAGGCGALRTAAPSPPSSPAAIAAEAPSPWSYHWEEERLPPGGALAFQQDESCLRQREEFFGMVPEYMKWRFAPPQSSEWLQFNSTALCQKLTEDAAEPGHARMLFVGDSMSSHQMLSLMMWLGPYEYFDFTTAGRVKSPKVRSDDWLPAATNTTGTKNYGAYACNGSLWIQHEGSQNLGTDLKNTFAFREHVDWVRSFDVVVLMLPWSVDGNVEASLDFWLSALAPRQKLAVRAATVGHERTGAQYNHSWNPSDQLPLFSSRLRAPLFGPREVVAYFRSVSGHPSWLRKRERTTKMLKRLRDRGVAVMDVFYLTTMMWDRHRDPLHYCMPGPIDRWNDVLFNLLMRGHLRDFEEWERGFSKAVEDMGGLVNLEGVPY